MTSTSYAISGTPYSLDLRAPFAGIAARKSDRSKSRLFSGETRHTLAHSTLFPTSPALDAHHFHRQPPGPPPIKPPALNPILSGKPIFPLTVQPLLPSSPWANSQGL